MGFFSGSRAAVDLVFCDLFMPDKEGLETIREIRRDHPGVPVVAVSGGGFAGRLDLLGVARRLGAVQAIRKPFTVQAVLEVVGIVLTTANAASDSWKVGAALPGRAGVGGVGGVGGFPFYSTFSSPGSISLLPTDPRKLAEKGNPRHPDRSQVDRGAVGGVGGTRRRGPFRCSWPVARRANPGRTHRVIDRRRTDPAPDHQPQRSRAPSMPTVGGWCR
jgi:hypothetical protein